MGTYVLAYNNGRLEEAPKSLGGRRLEEQTLVPTARATRVACRRMTARSYRRCRSLPDEDKPELGVE